MTRIFLDKKEIALPPSAVASWNDFVRHVETAHLDPHIAIRQIEVDGKPLFVEDLLEDSGGFWEATDQKSVIEISTATVHEMALEAIAEATAYLERVASAIPSLIVGLRSDPQPEAFDGLAQLYEGFYWLNMLLDRLGNSFAEALDGIEVGGRNARRQCVHLTSVLKLLVDSQAAGNTPRTADLLEHEISPAILECTEMLARAGDRIAGGPASCAKAQENAPGSVKLLTVE